MNIRTDPSRTDTLPQPMPAGEEAPIRAAFLPEDKLVALGESLAQGKPELPPGFKPFEFQARIREDSDLILEVYRETNDAQVRSETITPSGQWLLDNHYVIQETVFQIKRDLPSRFYQELPTVELADSTKIPRALLLAWVYVAHSDSNVSPDSFRALVQGYQKIQPLLIGELWALPSMLRFVLVENMRRLALRVSRTRRMRLVANELADKVLTGPAEDRLSGLPAYAEQARDTTFATQLLYRLRDGSQDAGQALVWLEQELEKSGTDAEEIIRSEHQTLSSGNVTSGNIIRGLRLIDDIDWTVWFEGVSRVDHLLREKSNFAALDFRSRDLYRMEIEDLARRAGRSEYEVAELVVEKAQPRSDSDTADVGLYLVGPLREAFEAEIGYRPGWGKRIRRLMRRGDWASIVLPVLALTMLLLGMTAAALSMAGLSTGAIILLLVLFCVPASEGAVGFFNTVVLLFLKPSHIVGYEYRDGVPENARTLVVVPSLIGSRDDADESVRMLELHFLSNMHGAVHFALLSDWPDSKEEQSQADLEILDYLRKQVAALNARYPVEGPARFHLLHRRRLYNDAEGCWMGWERKRGKLHELNQLLRGDAGTTFFPPDTPLPDDVVYVMTLDADTRMLRDVVRRLVGKLSHPLNKPRFDAARRVVTRGYGILQPRVTASLTTGDEASFFQRVFSSNRGLDPYVFAVSDLYQDVFHSGTFTGKGLYHIDAFEAALKDRIPENTVLSHDLLEGSYAHAALVTDVEVVEDYPTRYSVDASRHHRWARGDWQLLPYILNPKSGVPGLSRWKMVDNLRRSLTPIFWVMAAVAGWTLLPFSVAAQWQALLILSLFMAPTFDIVNALLPKGRESTPGAHFNAVAHDVAFGTAMVALRVVLMAHNAWMMGDAIVRTLYRMLVSRRSMLEWRTASQASKADGGLAGYYERMWGASLIAIVGVAIPVLAGSTGGVVALIFAVFWCGSPAFAWLISQSAETEDRLHVSDADKVALRAFARRTWHYFETFVTEEHNWLPPDNFQETPAPIVAPRTSPTNIGVYLLSVVSARDFGWISLSDTVERLERTLTTIEKMQRLRGHLYNWYETHTLNPLQPPYVSAVDSGNLAGHLVAVARACDQWAEAPSVHIQGDFDGLLDGVRIISETLDALPDDRRQLRPLRQRLHDRIAGMRRAVETVKSQPELASIRTINLTVLAGEIRKLALAIHDEAGSDFSAALADWAGRLADTCEAHVLDAHSNEQVVADLRARLFKLRERARRFAFEMDFSFLLRPERKLLSIGYRVADRQLDEPCYDLLASEARLTSLFGVAKGDLPTEHWFKLGRPITQIGLRGALMSWSGSMFEYLMPPLVMKEPRGGILNQTDNLVVRRQISYARSRGTPWGISEAAFNARDPHLTYQYTNFGVPGLGLKRGLGHDMVIAPYATMLAAQFMPEEAVKNLMRLKDLGALGRYGYYDAVDFTPGRVPEGAACAVVHNYYAHHQGMSIAAIANVVFEGRMRERFHSDPVIEAAELLLQEKPPRDIPVATIRTDIEETTRTVSVDFSPDVRRIADPANALKATSLMSNGRYGVMVTACGSGYSRWNDLAVTRWQADPIEDRQGTYLFLRDLETNDWWSATAEPRRIAEEKTHTRFADDKATFVKAVGSLRSEMEVLVASECDGEGRRITIHNDGPQERHIEVTSFAELVLAPEATDSAHPAFSKMFVETEISSGSDRIFATRRKRAPDEADIHLAHIVVGAKGARSTEAETDRRAFIGRGRTLADAAAFDPGARLSGASGFVLDPVVALRQRLRIPPNRKVSLTFWTVAAGSRAKVEEAVGMLDAPESFERQSTLGWTRSQVQTRHMDLTLAESANVQRLGRWLLYPDAFMRMPGEAIASGLGAQSALWPMAISGDYPIFAVRISEAADLDIVAQALRYQEYLRSRGLVFDLVVVNEQAASYIQDLQQAIEALCENSRARGKELGPRHHIFAVRKDLMDETSYRTLLAVAYVVIHTRNGKLPDQLERAEAAAHAERLTGTPVSPARRGEARQEAEADGTGLSFWNGYGGFDRDGEDYVVRLRGTTVTPQPWIDVLANGDFGFHISAEGAAFTWSRNSRDFQLTAWSNDPVTNRPGEAFYIHDRQSGKSFSPLAAVVRDPDLTYEARFGQGVVAHSTQADGLSTELTQLVDGTDSIRIARLVLRNGRGEAASLRVYAYAEWVLGTNRAKNAATIVPSRDDATGALLAKNPYHLDFGDRVAFLASDAAGESFTADRCEFLGQGSVEFPQAVLSGAALSGKIEAGMDPCAALARDIEIPAGGEATIFFLMGDAGSADEAAELVEHHRQQDFDVRLEETRRQWRGLLDTVRIETPDAALDAMINHWLPYQAVACRLKARSAFYQASGAFGFRDQLQDTLALLLHDPALARGQILNAAARQFREGDVMHWWLPRTGAGVRTIISDDVVWLGYAVAHYVAAVGDVGLLDEQVPFVEGPALEKGEHDQFLTPKVSGDKASIYEHCALALDLAVKRTAATGLPLILGGDWNDGMNRVGEGGKGDSVWLGWFLMKALGDFIPLARERGDTTRVRRWEKHARTLKQALENSAWDGRWYRRASYDDGTPLGSHHNEECRIDSIAQSWSVLSGEGDPVRSRTALDSVVEHLVDEKLGIVKLFTPPFVNSDKDPGYIMSYPPGVRENGGQYTHAAAWVVLALAEIGMKDEAYRCLSMLNPVNHALDRAAADRYRVEPFVVAADVYSEGAKAGRGGWTWYTGSAGWLYRAAVEGLIGIRRRGDRLSIEPALPSHWEHCAARVQIGEATYSIRIERSARIKVRTVEVDGKRSPDGTVRLGARGEVGVVVKIPSAG